MVAWSVACGIMKAARPGKRGEKERTRVRILIVEDEARLAQALGQILQEAHYSTDIVCDGEDG